MRYDIRVNNIFYREIEGRDIEQALARAGMDVDFSMTGANCGILHYDRADIVGVLESDTDRDVETLLDEANHAAVLQVDFGPAE